jgi:hypothetical protein
LNIKENVQSALSGNLSTSCPGNSSKADSRRRPNYFQHYAGERLHEVHGQA